MKLYVKAPAKINLCLFVGPHRADGRHELVTLFESVSLADELSVSTRAGVATDAVRCPGLAGPNLVSGALAALRAAGWQGPALEVEIIKRIPLAGGMGGGSADAAALLRAAHELHPVGEHMPLQIAAELGADVPSQLAPGLAIGTAAGEHLERRPPLGPHAYVVVPQAEQLSTREVYAEADRLGLARDQLGLNEALERLRLALASPERLPESLLVNDLQEASLSLLPRTAEALRAVRQSGAEHALVSGSGPTVVGLFWGEMASERARASAASLSEVFPGTTIALPVEADFAAPRRAA